MAAENISRDINNIANLMKSKGKIFSKVFVYVLPQEKEGLADNLELIKTSIGMDVKIYAVNYKYKHYPQGKSSKAKPGKPAIYLE